jgi:hypothetical protein
MKTSYLRQERFNKAIRVAEGQTQPKNVGVAEFFKG